MLKRLLPVNFHAIKMMVSVREALELTGWRPLRTVGEVARGPCPFHGSSHPKSRSLAVSRTGYYCHKCQARGDVVHLWAQLHGLTQLHAALQLCAALRIAVPRLQS